MLCGICYGMVLSRTDGWLNARMIKRDETYLMTVSIVINCHKSLHSAKYVLYKRISSNQ